MSAWQPIETAPKDGTEFLGAWWFQGRLIREVCRFYTPPLQAPKAISARLRHRVDPTIWQPLPEPPEGV